MIKHYVEEFKEKRFPNHFMWIFPPLCDRLALQHASPVLQADVEAMHAMHAMHRDAARECADLTNSWTISLTVSLTTLNRFFRKN